MPRHPSNGPRHDGIFSIPLEFEFDPDKSAANAVKHGIDFIDAQRLWMDERRVEVPARSATESRIQVIGRGGRLRIISVRRARYGEKDFYIDGQGNLGE